MRPQPEHYFICLPAVAFNRINQFQDFKRGSDDFEAVEFEEAVGQMRGGAFIAADPGVILY